jgi:hypothetical protein
MSKGLQWLIGIGVVLVVAAMLFSIVAPFVLPRVGLAMPGIGPGFGGGREFGFWGPGHMFGGRGMMGGLRLPFLCLRIIGPLAAIGLIVLAVALLMRKSPAPVAAAPIQAPAAPVAPAPATSPCVHCGQPLEAGWKACPYCGEKI